MTNTRAELILYYYKKNKLSLSLLILFVMTFIFFLSVNIIISFVVIILLFFSAIFYKENESRATVVSVLFACFFGVLLYFTILLASELMLLIILSIFVLSTIILGIPFKNKTKYNSVKALKQYDERDVMFSRMELKEGTNRFEEYYKNNPNNKIVDNKFREKAGLLSNKATKYHKLKFASAKANFNTVDIFTAAINEDKLQHKQNIETKELTDYIRKWLKQIGAINVGITELKPYHLYSNKGRGEKYGEKIINKHKLAIAFTVEMDKNMLDAAPNAEVIMESSQQYLESAKIAAQLTYFIRNLGYSAKPHFDGNYDIICPVVAKDAGLGEIGRMGLLMSHELGPRVRIAVVTTDIPLETISYKYKAGILDFCTICKKCADNCPAKAISFDKRKEDNGVLRWKINHESCFTYWNITGTDCGKCIQVCPFSHPNNFMHNMVRKGIENSFVFGKFALKMDDLFYGRKPKVKN
jgi:reductive dehalogenase